MPLELRTLEVWNRQEWRRWLSQHNASSPGVWLVFHKNHTGVKSLAYEDSVRDALCFGWIDSLIKRRPRTEGPSEGVEVLPGVGAHLPARL